MVQLIAVGDEQYEIQLEIRSDERRIAMGPFVGPGVEEPGIETDAFGKATRMLL